MSRTEEHPPLVWIKWIDSMSQSGWKGEEKLREWCRTGELTCYTAGFLFHQDEQSVSVAQSCHLHGNMDASYDNVMRIPRVAIQKLRKIPFQV